MKRILGMPIAVFIIGLLVIGSGAALLVKYVSNTVTHTVNVLSPLQMTGDTELTMSIFGGDKIQYSVTTTNLVNASIESYPVTIVIGPDIWTGLEFTEIWLEDNAGLHDITTILYAIRDDGVLIPFSNVDTLNTTKLKLFFDNTGTGTLHTYSRPVGFVEQNNVSITTNAAIMPGTYTIKSCQLFDWSGECA